MNFTYYKFLFIDTIKRKSVWITWLIYLFTIVAFMIILPVASTLSVYQLWSNTTIAICQTFVGVAAAIFTAILAINVFKNSNEEGTELIIISKPISRVKIVVSKFVMFFTLCILVNLTAVLVTCFTIFIPSTEKKFYWGLVISMFIGNLIVFGVYGALAILLTVRFVKAGIIVTNVIVSVVLFAYQILSLFVFGNSILSLSGVSKGTVITQGFILPVRNKDGSYTEKDFVNFTSTADKEGVYEMKVTDWNGVKDYWTNRNAKENWKLIIGTDIGSQFALSYLTTGVNGYSDRQARRMYNFSRYYDYQLTQPASPEFYENNSPLKFVYGSDRKWTSIGSYGLYLPNSYYFPGIRSTKASYLKGTVSDVIPVADLKGKGFFEHYDVPFEQNEWQKYGPLFDKMYDKIFKYDIVDGNGNKHYYCDDFNYRSSNSELNNIWCLTTDNIKKYYQLVWACLTGHHNEDKYFGNTDNDPLLGYTIKDFDINSVFDLNSRVLQFKDYVFYKVYDEQHELMINGLADDSAEWAVEQPYYTQIKAAIESVISDYGLTCSGDGIGERGFVLRATKDGGSTLIQPGTQTVNTTLIRYATNALKQAWSTQGKTWNDPEWINIATNGSLAKWNKTTGIVHSCVYANEEYLFDSLETPERNNNWFSEQYITRESWYPYWLALAGEQEGSYFPYGQNIQLSFYSCTNRIQFWVFAVIWGCIALAAYGAAFVVYNKYDIK